MSSLENWKNAVVDTIEIVGGGRLAKQLTKPSLTAPKSGLDWSIVSKKGENRAQHVMKHGANDLQKKSHGVFYGDPVKTTNSAWANKGNIEPITKGGVDKYQIPSQNSGYSGGYSGQGQNLNNVTIITKEGTDQIITSYPSYGQ